MMLNIQGVSFELTYNGYVWAMVGHLKNVSPIFAQITNRSTNIEFTTVIPTIANTMLCVRLLFSKVSIPPTYVCYKPALFLSSSNLTSFLIRFQRGSWLSQGNQP